MANKIRIPKSFEVMGKTFTVTYHPNMAIAGDVGHCTPNTGTITLECNPDIVNQDAIEQTLWHEIVHAILFAVGTDEQAKDEVLVDHLASGIHQVLKSMRGDQ